MEVITIDSKAFKELNRKIDSIAKYVVEKLEDLELEKTLGEKWLDSHQVCRILNISIRTLQRLRKDKLISYSILRGRCLYKLSEIERGLEQRMIPAKADGLKNFIAQLRAESVEITEDVLVLGDDE